MPSATKVTATLPTSDIGCRVVMSDEVRIRECAISSNPVTENSSETIPSSAQIGSARSGRR